STWRAVPPLGRRAHARGAVRLGVRHALSGAVAELPHRRRAGALAEGRAARPVPLVDRQRRAGRDHPHRRLVGRRLLRLPVGYLLGIGAVLSAAAASTISSVAGEVLRTMALAIFPSGRLTTHAVELGVTVRAMSWNPPF